MTIPLDTVRIAAWADPLGERTPIYRMRYGVEFWQETPGTTDRAEADAWAAWWTDFKAGRVENETCPWAEQERAMDALRRQWNSDPDPAYVAADGNRYSDKAEHDFYWQEER